MATAHQIRDLITETTTGSARPRVPREVRDEVCRYAIRRRKAGAAWAAIARETGLDVRKLQRWNTRARRAASVPVLRPVEVLPEPSVVLTLIAPSGVRIEGLAVAALGGRRTWVGSCRGYACYASRTRRARSPARPTMVKIVALGSGTAVPTRKSGDGGRG